MDSSSATSAATEVCISDDLCFEEHPVFANSSSEVNSDADSHVNSHGEVTETSVQRHKLTDVESKENNIDEVNMDVQDQSSFDTTIEYSVYSDVHDGKIADKSEAQTTILYYAESTTEPDICSEKTLDVRTDTVASDIQKSVDIMNVPNGVNIDLMNNPTVCSPPTLMVV